MVSSKVFVIFDVDGTINQTEVYAVKAYRKALEETGKTGFSDQELIERIGAPFEQDVRYFFGENESEQVELFRKLIQKYWINGIKDSAKTFEGIHQMLEELKEANSYISSKIDKYRSRSLLIKEIEKDDCDAVIGGYRRITETGKILKTLKLNDGEWSKYMIMAPWAKIYRTQYLIQNDITFLENNLGEDMYFNLKALLLGNVKSIDYVGYNWFFNTKSVSNTIQKNITQLQVFELIDSCYNMLKENGILEKNYEMIEAHFIKYIIWLILFSTKKLDYKTISKEYDKLFNWLKQKFPNYKKNKVVRLWKPKGELFSIRLIVITMSIANKVGLGKVLVYVYSIL